MRIILNSLILIVCLSSYQLYAQQDTAHAMGNSDSLDKQIETALLGKGPDYKARTEHLLADGSPRFTNRLILEDSPYLIQHAHNPVDWYAWGKQAFDKARRENKPVFLSIGYSTCHWCHVMERESFENLDIARFMNEHFISIKVDRERRPDVDATYMMAVSMINGQGGWPMSSFLTADAKTFFGGTYFPPQQFLDLLNKVNNAWHEKPDLLTDQAERISAAVQGQMSAVRKAQTIDQSVVLQAVNNLLRRYDDVEGGFGAAPKFPSEPSLFLLLDVATRFNNSQALDAALFSLHSMAQGGIYDQIGGGFHRYSTDSHWLVPHFEKMLYNQANLSRLYLQAYALTGQPEFARIAAQTLDYVLREMTSTDGGFYSATDADSEGKEGEYFIWTQEQIRNVLHDEEANFALEIFAVTETGNFAGKNILTFSKSFKDTTNFKHQSLGELEQLYEVVRDTLRKARSQRIPPLRDEKIITAWNGMMITALASAGSILNEKRYLDSAIKAADFIWSRNRQDNNQLWRSNLGGKTSVQASQEDYAYFAEALLTLYDIAGEKIWLERAEIITASMLSQFWDAENHGFFMNSGLSEVPMMARPKDDNDSAIPSGNAVALRLLAKLARRTGKTSYQNYATRSLAAFSSAISKQPDIYAYMLLAANELLYQEQGQHQYAAKGHVNVSTKLNSISPDQSEIILTIKLSPGWHINANKTLHEDLIPTKITLTDIASSWVISDIEYPPATIKRLGFQKDRLALYEDTVQLKAHIEKSDTYSRNTLTVIPVQLNLQACNDKICLPPEVLTLQISSVIFKVQTIALGD